VSRSQQVTLDDRVLDYVLAGSRPLPSGIEDAMATAAELGYPTMVISPDQAVFIRFLVRLVGARRVLEIGTFVGVSALVLAEAVGTEGSVVCLDQSEEWTDRARRLWDDSGLADRIELRLGDAHDTLRSMTDEVFDVVFIDADKPGYVDYLDQVTPRLRDGGLLLVDNTLWSGRVTDESDDSPSTVALREFNRLLAGDERYDVAMTALGDGLTLARKV
jgi:caffeoyl-CoA O-methyltransferase